MKRLIVGVVLIVAFIFLLSASIVLAQDFCQGNFDYDDNVDGSDASIFKEHFGRSSYDNPCPPDGPVPVEKTGQTTCFDEAGTVIDCTGTGQDGEDHNGVTWPNPRFTDNGDGTVTDNLTGLIWLKDANCFGQRTWNQALSDCNGLSDGTCGLTDGSNASDWRLPNLYELRSLIHIGYYDPALPNTTGTDQGAEGDPFTNITNTFDYNHWTSTTVELSTSYAWYVTIYSGATQAGGQKTNSNNLWCVRGGH